VRPPSGAEINVSYDDRLLPTSVTRGQSERKMGYNANGRIVYLEDKVGAIARLIKTFEYNRINFLEKITVKNVDVNGADADIVMRFISSPQDAWRVRRIVYDTGGQTRLLDYDHLGHLRRNALGSYVEETAYDLNGNPVEFKQGGVVTRTMSYDGHDRLLDLVQRATDSRSETTTHGYHPGGQIRSVVVRDDTFGESYNLLIDTIDALGRPKSRRVKGSSDDGLTRISYPVSSAGGSVVAEGPRDRVESSHDDAGYPSGMRNGIRNATLVPDGNGNITSVRSAEDARTYTAGFGFNSLDQLDRVDDDLGLVADPDPRLDGEVERMTDGRGKTVTRDFSVLGEIRRATRANGVQFNWRRDANRQLKLSGDATLKGHEIDYDTATLRMTAFRLRSGAAFGFSSPNHLNLPESVAIPGGQMSLGYDNAGRVVSRDVSYNPGLPYKMTVEHDAMGRPRDMTYGADGRYSASYKYDLLGPLTEASYTESHGTFTVISTPYSDGTRQTLGYPSGLSLVEERDPSGRLLVVRGQGGGDLYRVTKYVGAGERGEVTLGDGLIREVSRFDMRRRNTARRYVRGTGGVLAEVRYRYDAAGNIVARQEVHRHGRAEVYAYDDGDRLSRADFELRPPVQELVRTSSTGLEAAFGLDAGSHARKYGYDGLGLDLLQNVETVSPNLLAISPTPFVQSLSDADAMLFPIRLDGVSRAGPDPLGNTIDTRLLVTSPGGSASRIPATLKYTGLSQLAEIVRNDGLTLSYEHRPDGLVHRRRVAGSGGNSDTALVWHEGRLLEEYERAGGTNQLRARYLYADEDSPFAADFRDPASGELRRYWYLRDALSSVVALVDADGAVVERYRYDPWGRPVIEGRDGRPPRVAFVAQSSGSLLVQFTEPVLPAYSPPAPAEVPGADGSLAVDSMRFPQDFIRVQTTTGLDEARLVLEEDLPGGFPYGTVVRVIPQGAGTIVGLSVTGDAVTDEWDNGNISEIITFSAAGAGQPVYQAPGALQDSRPPQLAQSAFGSPMLFHGQYWDADAGLLYLRARFYDPGTGMFLQQDPMGYEDSPNLYAFGGNNPVSFRDPSGKARGRSKGARINDTVPDGAPVADSSLPTVPDGGSGGIAARKQPRSSRKADAISSAPQPKSAPKGPETKQQLRERVMGNLKMSADARSKSAYREPSSRKSAELPYEIYYTPKGEKRIRFRASAAKTAQEANPGRNYSPDAEAGINIEGDVYVFEGRHRAAGAARGDFVPEELGGVPGKRGWLDYAYRSSTPDDIGLEVKNLKLDYTKKEASTPAEADLLWDLENNGPLVIR
jgi:RHS repeat-associated protein